MSKTLQDNIRKVIKDDKKWDSLFQNNPSLFIRKIWTPHLFEKHLENSKSFFIKVGEFNNDIEIVCSNIFEIITRLNVQKIQKQLLGVVQKKEKFC